MTNDVSKPGLSHGAELPAWPEDTWLPRIYRRNTFPWARQERDAALARMEALVEYAQHEYECAKWSSRHPAEAFVLLRSQPCTCGLDALLAACEREEGR